MTNALETVGRAQRAFFTGPELMEAYFPEPRWAVPGLICEGLTLLAGAPKLGKSWLALALSLDIAAGEDVLGGVPVEAGEVLYLALEDTPRRVRDRLNTMLAGGPPPSGFAVMTMLPPMPQGVQLVDEYLAEHPNTRLVVVDVLGKIRSATPSSQDRYEADYGVMGQLKSLADRHRLAVVVVTHTRKMPDEDVFSTVSGSVGLTGAADATLVLRRNRSESQAVLHVTGRDIFESEYAMDFDSDSGRWRLAGSSLGDAANVAKQARAKAGLGDRAQAVLDDLGDHPEGTTPKDVAERLGIEATQVRVMLGRLVDSSRAERIGRGVYRPVTSVTSVTSPTDETAERNSSNACNTVCQACNEPMLLAEAGQTTHPGCEAT